MADPIRFRSCSQDDEPFLREMLYHAIFVPEGADPVPRDIVQKPELSRYVDRWCDSHDFGVIALLGTSELPVGAAWARLLTGDGAGYGYVDEETPELSIAVLPQYRGRGIGTQLLRHLLSAIEPTYTSISLSVTRGNPAMRLYQRMGFVVVSEKGDSCTMVRRQS